MKHWCAHEAFKKAIKRKKQVKISSHSIYFYDENETIPLEIWEETLIKAANLVEKWGENYLPIFERVELELEKVREKLNSLERVRNIANNKNSLSILLHSLDFPYFARH